MAHPRWKNCQQRMGTVHCGERQKKGGRGVEPHASPGMLTADRAAPLYSMRVNFITESNIFNPAFRYRIHPMPFACLVGSFPERRVGRTANPGRNQYAASQVHARMNF